MDNEEIRKYPEEIAEIIFKEQPLEPKSYQLYCESELDDTLTIVDVFEIFVIIMMEGIFIKFGSITKETLNLFNEQTINSLQPYFKSLGYKTNIDVITSQETEQYNDFYCRIILRCDPSWNAYFEMHPEIEKDYRFIFGGNSPKLNGEKCTLNNLYAIFSHKNLVYKISFSLI